MNYRNALILPLAAAALAGCASGGAQINSRTMAGTEPLKRVVIFYNAKSPHFNGSLYSTFVAETQRRLESCGATVSTLEFDPLELDMKGKFTQTVEKSNPDAVLFFLRNGGNLVNSSGGVSGNLYFDAEAKDKTAAKTLWKARIDYRTLTQNMFTDDKQSGERFAAQFVSKLASDRLFSGCPAEAVTQKS